MAEAFDKKPVEQAQQAAQSAAHKETEIAPVRRWRTVLFQGYLIAAVSAFAILAVLASTTAYFPIDLTITKLLQSLNSLAFLALMRAVSWLGYFPQAVFVAAVFVALVYWFGYHWEAWMTLLAVVSGNTLNLVLKWVVHRPRPPASLVDVYQTVTNYSFPSGHVMFYVSLFGFLLFLAYALLKRSWLRAAIVIACAALIVLVGFSRIYLGEHWASDVLGGYLAGSLDLWAVVIVYRWGKGRFFVRQPVAKPSEIPVTADEKKPPEK